jgi:hypothetical protein
MHTHTGGALCYAVCALRMQRNPRQHLQQRRQTASPKIGRFARTPNPKPQPCRLMASGRCCDGACGINDRCVRQIGGVYFIVTVDYSSSSDAYEVSAFDAKTGTTHRLTVSADEVGAKRSAYIISPHIFSV